MTPIERVLDLARWAPSGDNTQPWRFELVAPTEAIIHSFDTRSHCVYDLTGGPSQIAVGALLETIRVAASTLRMRSEIERMRTPTEESLQFRVRLVGDDSLQADPLAGFILERCTDRRPFLRRPATPAEKAALEASIGRHHRIVWFEGPKRLSMARLMFDSSKIRLTIPEAYAVHRDVIEWHTRTSETKIPDQAVGLDPLGLLLMRWAMRSWRRTRILGNYFGGTILPRLQLELIPGIRCAAHFLICAAAPPKRADDYLEAGAAVQRFWLTTERLGLRHQPEMTPLIFAGYAREGRRFTVLPLGFERAQRIQRRLTELAGREAAETAVWMGRIGAGSRPSARSLRRPLSDLLIRRPPAAPSAG